MSAEVVVPRQPDFVSYLEEPAGARTIAPMASIARMAGMATSQQGESEQERSDFITFCFAKSHADWGTSSSARLQLRVKQNESEGLDAMHSMSKQIE